LNETVSWLKRALDAAKPGARPSKVYYAVHSLDGCMIDWRATLPTGEQKGVKAALHYADASKAQVTQQDGGWVVSLPWSDGQTIAIGDATFGGFEVWFNSRETATMVEAAFKHAIELCATQPARS